MQLHYHAAIGVLLARVIAPQAPVAWVAAASIAPDLPYVVNLSVQALRKRGRDLERDDIASWRWTYPCALFLHSIWAFAIAAAGAAWLGSVRGADGASLTCAVLLGYGSHITIDYLTHAKDPYPPLYPLSRRALCARFSYYDPTHGAAWVMRLARIATAALGVFVLLRR